ncbi:hypothetical protein GT354_14905 [Streptomyces sp. SID3343]|nr:hypothetical protein [Streptomyces sp. SID3343]
MSTGTPPRGRYGGDGGRHGTRVPPVIRPGCGAAFPGADRGDADADASHRGGNPGFVQVLSPTRLRRPDYLGNSMFPTLDNLELNPAAGLFPPGWETGSTLHLSGSARTVWAEEEIARVPGAQRLVEFEVTDVVEIQGAVGLRWSDPDCSRFNPPTG